jgi:Ca2+-binding RTX toxin-like protein
MTTINGTSAGETLTGGADADLIYGFDGLDTLTGAAGNDSLYGGDGNDVIYGGDDNDILDGGTGADYMVGGYGSDSYVVDSIYDVIVESNDNSDWRDQLDRVTSSVSFSSNTVERVTLIGSANINATYSGSNISVLTGNNGNNILSGGSHNCVLYGGDGDDTLYGRSGGYNDLYGGAGADALYGGGISSLARYDNSIVGVRVALYDPTLNTGEAAGDTYTNIVNLVGSGFSDQLFGNQYSNVIYGGAGNDWIDGVGGIDSLYGGDGHDTLVSRAGAQLLDGGAGFDVVHYDYAASGVSAALYNPSVNNGEAGGDSYVSIEGLVGSAHADWLYGDTNSNTIEGLAGDDWIDGLGGGDNLFGGNGNDHMMSRAGAQVLSGGAGFDTARYDYATGGVTAALFYSAANAGEAASDTYDGIEGLVGSTYADYLYGDAGANYIGGLAGSDVLDGRAGNDMLAGGLGSDYMLGGEGADNFAFVGDVQIGQYDMIGDFRAGLDSIGLPSYASGSVYVFDSAYGVTIGYTSAGSWYQIFVTNTHNTAEVLAGIYYA